MVNRKKWVLISSALICFLIAGRFVYLDIQRINNRPTVNSTLQGYGLTVDRQLSGTNQGFIIDLSGKNEFNNKVRFFNRSGSDNSFSLSVYLDYQQIPFEVGDNGSKVSTYTFDTKSNQEHVISVRFPIHDVDEGTHALSFTVVAGPYKHANQIGKSSNMYGVTVRYNLRTSDDKLFKKLPEADIPFHVLDATAFDGIMINQDTIPTGKAKIPPLEVISKPGGTVGFTILAGGDRQTEDYLAWVTIKGNQINLDNQNHKYWYFHVPFSKFAYKKIQIVAPQAKGDYDVCGYLAANPWAVLDSGFRQDVSVSSSYRFTLHVE